MISTNVLEMQKAQIIPASSTITIPITVARSTGKQSSYSLLNNTTHNDIDVIGVALRVSDFYGDGYSGATSSDAAKVGVIAAKDSTGTMLLTKQCCSVGFLNIAFNDKDNKVKVIVENIPLSQLIPTNFMVYVPVFWERFNAGKSTLFFTDPNGLLMGGDRSFELTLIHSSPI